MSKETIFNFFPICDDNIITQIGFRVHEFEGTDQEKYDFLLSRVKIDAKEMVIYNISDNYKVELPDGEKISGITHERYNNFLHNGTEGILYEPIYKTFNAQKNPLTVSTMYSNGEIKITKQEFFDGNLKATFTEKITEKIPNYYLTEFMTDEGFDLGELIKTDFLDSINILTGKNKFVSAIKLLMAAIDTIAFIEYGDVNNNFKDWLDKYCSLEKLKISSEELWEYRNSILHMTNSFSRKVINKRVKQLSFYVSEGDIEYLTGNSHLKYFNFKSLYENIIVGITNWCESYNTDVNKFELFCARYDSIISDNRYGKIE